MPFHQIPNPKNVDNGTEIQADQLQAEVNESGGQSEGIRRQIESGDNEQQQMFNEKLAKIENKLNHSHQSKLLELEKQQEQKLKTYSERIGELEKQQQQQMTIFHQLLKNCEKFSTLENFVVTALEAQQMQQQQKQMQISQKFSVLDNFVAILRDRFGNKFFYSVFAKCAIPSSDSGIFYYEMRILCLKNFARIGLATKAMPLDRKVGSYARSFAYGNIGFIWMNNSCWINLENKFGNDDIVGCGINLTNRRIIFTKNGR
ncbi:hypothetical protein niasHT_009083 [Heterodera trifolii]|uniref:B30.2/SPRY domain-containing protein n=1 Tax=Heterodera trifolii TaxID=157864 RepID=A0ABD2MAI0_9BILA